MSEAINVWGVRLKVLLITGVFASIANFITSTKAGNPVTPLEAMPGLLIMLVIIIVGCFIQEAVLKLTKLKLPSILFISLVSIICSVPGLLPFAEYVIASFGKINMMALCTPILSYAGIAIGKDLDTFKKQGVAIVCVALLTFLGTYLGSAVIAQIVLKSTGVI